MRLYSFIRVKLAVDAGEVNLAASAQVPLQTKQRDRGDQNS
jgi:hypothetical protein